MLYAPWRSTYATSSEQSKQESAQEHECVFCQQFQKDKDKENFILKRFDNCAVMLNRYPYNAGHLLIIPYKHNGLIDDLSDDTQMEIMCLIGKCSTILRETLKAEGVNIGINMGKAAGAGIPAHLHVHALPRWTGDCNFLPIFGETKVISYDLDTAYKLLKKEFDKLPSNCSTK